jgi:hypothetical protein
VPRDVPGGGAVSPMNLLRSAPNFIRWLYTQHNIQGDQVYEPENHKRRCGVHGPPSSCPQVLPTSCPQVQAITNPTNTLKEHQNCWLYGSLIKGPMVESLRSMDPLIHANSTITTREQSKTFLKGVGASHNNRLRLGALTRCGCTRSPRDLTPSTWK